MVANNSNDNSRWKKSESIKGFGILIRKDIDWEESGRPKIKVSKINRRKYYSFPMMESVESVKNSFEDLPSYNEPYKLITLTFWDSSDIFKKIANLNLEYVKSAKSIIAKGLRNSIERNGKNYEVMIVEGIEIYGDENLKMDIDGENNDNDDIFI